MDTLAIVPAFNEEKTISSVLLGLRRFVDVLVVDDGSSDNTAAIARSIEHVLCIGHDINQGVAKAILTGIEYGINNNYRQFVLIDADGAHIPEDTPSLVDLHLNSSNHITVGQRADFRQLEESTLPCTKYLANYFATNLINHVLDTSFPDVSCGFRVLGEEAAKKCVTSDNGFGIMYSMLLEAKRHSLRIGFGPVGVRYDASVPLLTNKKELYDLLDSVIEISFFRAKETTANNIKILKHNLMKDSTLSLSIGGVSVCIVPVTDDAVIFQKQNMYFAKQSDLVL